MDNISGNIDKNYEDVYRQERLEESYNTIGTLRIQVSKKSIKQNYYLWLEKVDLLRTMLAEVDNHEEAIKYSKMLIASSSRDKILKLDENKQDKALDIIRNNYFYLGGRGLFHYFMLAMEFDRPKAERFYQPRMKVLKPIVDKLQDLHDRKLRFLMIKMPPRTGKTTLGLMFLTMCNGENVNKSSLGISYAGSVAGSFYDGMLEFIKSETYHFKEIFPNAEVVETDSKEMSYNLKDIKRYKTMNFRSIDGQITGALEATDILYLDDLIQNIEEAKNKDRLEKAWDKVRTDIYQRRKPLEGCVTLVIGTNWSIDDPLSRLAELEGNNPDSCIVTVPALDPVTDESNFLYDGGVGFDTAYYQRMRDVTFANDPVTFSCVYQQEVMERIECTFSRDEFKRYTNLPSRQPDRRIAFVDVAFGGNDYLSMPVCYVYGNEGYIVDWLFIKGKKDVTEPLVSKMICKHKLVKVRFEANNGGAFYADDVKKMLKDTYRYKCAIEAVPAPTTIGKYERIEQYQPDIVNFNYLSEDLLHDNKYNQYKLALQNVFNFRSSANPKYQTDDAPDSLAGLSALFLRDNKKSGKVKGYSRAKLGML